MISADSFVDHLRGLGYSFFAGVPCSFFTSFVNYVIDDPRLDYIGATSEGEAVGITMGAFLAGRKTVTMCQNSGLGNMVNPLTSLNHPFRIPTLLIVTWRGQPGVNDEPQHEQMGRIMLRLLETLEIPWREFPQEESQITTVMAEAEASMEERQLPFALVMPKGSVASCELRSNNRPKWSTRNVQETLFARERLTRTEAIELILETLHGDEAILATTGKTNRELFEISDRENHLYIVGGMGIASAIGFGIAHALPEQPVVVLDGDGAALMKLGSLATIGAYQPMNLLHIVLDNEVHDSTGGQQTASPIVQFARIAAAANYRSAIAVDRREDIRDAVHALRRFPGPSLLHIKIRPGSPENLGRPTVKPHEVKERFSAFLRTRGSASLRRDALPRVHTK